MRLLSIQGLQTKSKPALLRYIIKHLRRKSKKHLVMLAYNISKSKLPRLRKTKRKALPRYIGETAIPFKRYKKSEKFTLMRLSKTGKIRKKRTFSRKQLAAQALFAKRARAGTLRRQ